MIIILKDPPPLRTAGNSYPESVSDPDRRKLKRLYRDIKEYKSELQDQRRELKWEDGNAKKVLKAEIQSLEYTIKHLKLKVAILFARTAGESTAKLEAAAMKAKKARNKMDKKAIRLHSGRHGDTDERAGYRR